MMTLIQQFVNKGINLKLVTRCILSVVLIATPALADYTPPSDQKTSTAPTEGGTTRGCDGKDMSMPLIVLASRKYVGRTISGRPTFAWFVPNSRSFEMEFTITEIAPGGKKGKEILAMSLQSSPGIMKLSPFSDDAPGLKVGKEYFWQVAILCRTDTSESALVDGASIEVIEMPASVSSQLDKAINSEQRATIYAQAGLWYDALGEALKLAQASKLGALGSALLKDLAKWEAPETTPQRCRQNNSGRGTRQTTQKLVLPECRRQNLEQIANSQQ